MPNKPIEPDDFIEEKLIILDEEETEFTGFDDEPYYAVIGIKKAVESAFKIRTIENPIPPGTYSAADFARHYPRQYSALLVAGMPNTVHSLITITS